MAQITLKQLEAFVQVADLASFRRAAEKLNTTQPNISARISGLEALLDRQLLIRDAGTVRLTPAGDALMPKARAVLRAIDGFVIAAGDDQLFEGVLRLGVTEMVVNSWLPSVLKAFRDRYPAIDVALTVDLSANLSEMLATRNLDLAFQNGPFQRQMTGNEDLGRFAMAWVAAPMIAPAAGVLTSGDLSRIPILTNAKGTQPFDQLKEHLAAAGTSAQVVSSTNMAACLQMAKDGLGIACLPEFMLLEDLEAGRLVRLDYPWVPDSLPFYARYDADSAPSFVGEAAQMARRVALGGS